MSYPPGLQHTATCASYARELLQERAGLAKARYSTIISYDLQVDLEQIVDRFWRAWNNPIRLSYKLEDILNVLESTPKHKDSELRSRFLGPFPENREGVMRLLHEPTVFLDATDKVIGWYLPNAFTERRSEHVYKSAKALSKAPETILTANQDKISGKGRRPNWSHNAGTKIRVLKPGLVNMSVCWYNLGFGPHKDKPPSPSTSLGPIGGGPQFISSQRDTNTLMGVILALTHPRLYDLQMEVLLGLHHGRIVVHDRERFDALMEHWSSPFTAFTLTANRETPFHRHTKGGKMLLDLLATFGSYSGGRMEVPLLGSRFVYNPGTAVLIPGYLFEHGVSRVDGERVGLGSFFRPNVGFAVLPQYRELPPPHVEALADAHGLDLPW